jgi:hypothetical protein
MREGQQCLARNLLINGIWNIRMSNYFFKKYTLAKVAAIVLGFGISSLVLAKAPFEPSAEVSATSGAVSLAPLPPTKSVELRLAMMDMDNMKKGAMPADASMPGGTMPDSMSAPSSTDMMGRMRGAMPAPRAMSNMAPTARLPGFPGASRLYHVGATGFFLDHPEHITLSVQQQTMLNRLKEKNALDRATADRRIEDAEQELWTLTAVDSPDAVKIETKVRAIEKLRGDQRLAFIRAVGEAGKVLTPDQQSALLGTKVMSPATPMPNAKPMTAPAIPPMKME